MSEEKETVDKDEKIEVSPKEGEEAVLDPITFGELSPDEEDMKPVKRMITSLEMFEGKSEKISDDS